MPHADTPREIPHIWTLITIIAAALLALNLIFWMLQPNMVFYPTRTLQATPEDWGLPFDDVHLTAEDGTRLHGWFIPHPRPSHTLLFLHGNAGNISHRGDTIHIFHRLGLSVLILDYRGYGQSEGTATEAGLYADARAGWTYLTDDRGLASSSILIFGRSLGASIATDLASRTQPAGLILESGFSSARDMARHLYPGLNRLVLRRFEFDSERRLEQVDAPVLVLHSRDDEIVPYALGRRLFDAAPEPKSFVTLVGDHNGGFLASQPEYERRLAAFISSLGTD